MRVEKRFIKLSEFQQRCYSNWINILLWKNPHACPKTGISAQCCLWKIAIFWWKSCPNFLRDLALTAIQAAWNNWLKSFQRVHSYSYAPIKSVHNKQCFPQFLLDKFYRLTSGDISWQVPEKFKEIVQNTL